MTTLLSIQERLAQAILVLRERDGVPITDEQATERAANISQWVIALIDEARDPNATPLLGEPVDYIHRTADEYRATRPTPEIDRALELAAAELAAYANIAPPPFTPREVSTIRNVPCDRCGKTIKSDGVAVQVAAAPSRMFRNYHRGRCP